MRHTGHASDWTVNSLQIWAIKFKNRYFFMKSHFFFRREAIFLKGTQEIKFWASNSGLGVVASEVDPKGPMNKKGHFKAQIMRLYALSRT